MKELPEYIAPKLAVRLQKIYKENFSESFLNRILRLILDNLKEPYVHGELWDESDVALITYGNSVVRKGEYPLVTLHHFLKDHLKEEISYIHILPFFPYSSDDGFSVIDYYKVDHELGEWNHVEKIGNDFKLMFDLVINHVSRYSNWFQNFLKNTAPGNDFFIEENPAKDFSKVVRPRSSPLLTLFETSAGKKFVWTTFSDDQIDLNFENPEVLFEMIRVFLFYISKGARIIRLDAIAFLWKSPGTTCLHLPETHEIVKLFRDIAYCINPKIIILTETNVPHKENISYFGNGDEAHMVYQFGLPPLLLYTLHTGNAKYLTKWALSIPEIGKENTFLNFTASHDGIGVRPLEGILPAEEIKKLLGDMEKKGGLISYKSDGNGSKSPYEINITYFDALKGQNNNYEPFICSQTIMMGLKGIPAFYIHSLLSTSNNYEGVEKTGSARSINRKVLGFYEITDKLNSENITSSVFAELCRIIRIRKKQKAFHPNADMKVIDHGDSFFCFTRTFNDEKIVSISNITGAKLEVSGIYHKTGISSGLIHDLLSNTDVNPDQFSLNPYQTMWLSKKKKKDQTENPGILTKS